MNSPPGPLTVIGGRECLYFGGTSYYSLHSHPLVLAAAQQATETYGINSATTRSSYGITPLLEEVEKAAAHWFDTESAVVLASGFLTSYAGLRVLQRMKNFDLVFLDEHAHYSIRMAVEALETETVRFVHGDAEDLRQKLATQLKAGQRPLVATDGIFAVYGETAPLPGYLEVLEPYDGYIWVDDAHASGVTGTTGQGTMEYYNIQSDRIFTGTTLSKAFGGFGGLVFGKESFIREVRNDPVLNGASLVPVPALAAAAKGMELLKEHPEWREQLHENAGYLKAGLRQLGILLPETPAPIAAFTVGSGNAMEQIRKELFNNGIAIQHIRYAGTPDGGVLRIVVFSTHTIEQIDILLDALKSIL